MNNLDLRELRSKLNFTHESQGVSKSVAMKLMQELEEARARHRKAWGRAEKAEAAVARVRESLSNHPRACEEHPENDAIKCGWKNAVIDVQNALDGEPNE